MSIALAQWKSYANVLVYSVGVTFDSTPTAGRLIVPPDVNQWICTTISRPAVGVLSNVTPTL
jgi:hypothetical protein